MLVCCDNEGCIIDAKGRAFDNRALADLADAIAAFPGTFTICTGRSQPYVEAMVQTLGLVDSEIPCVCEGGGLLYVPRSDRYEVIGQKIIGDAVRTLLPPGSYREELGKLSCHTVYPEPGYTVEGLFDLIVAGGLTGVELNRSIASVDITPKGVDKAHGIAEILIRTGLGWSDVLAIGDSWNDLPMLRSAGLAACPANAVAEVKAVADYVSPEPSTRGVIDILRWASSDGVASHT
jgi:hydroxymethylpyrimidine pyrophosphatase-like HAD family hydrolase